MSLRTMPMLFVNMGGEMCYILDQRLQAQSVKSEKSGKVLTDIVGTMFSKKFLDELFKTQELYSRRSMRTLFEKLAHSSIMRLNQTSMDKLYDLMTMAVKFQLQQCASPKDLLLVTLNHLDGIRKLVQGVANLQSQIDYCYELLAQNYFVMNDVEVALVRWTLLAFYQEARVKVSLLLREKKQNDEGRFLFATDNVRLPYGAQTPGLIQYYEKGEKGKTGKFEVGGSHEPTEKEGNLSKTAKRGERVINLGGNMYKDASATETSGGCGSAFEERGSGGEHKSKSKQKEVDAKDELKLLSHLLTAAEPDEKEKKKKKDDFSLSLFDNDEDEEQFVQLMKEQSRAADAKSKTSSKVIKIDASKRQGDKAIDKAMGELKVSKEDEETTKKKEKKTKGEDLLDMMDKAEDGRGSTRSSTRSSGSRPKSGRSDSKNKAKK